MFSQASVSHYLHRGLSLVHGVARLSLVLNPFRGVSIPRGLGMPDGMGMSGGYPRVGTQPPDP